MYLTILEYALVRFGLGAVRLMLRAVGLLLLVALWAAGVLARIVLRPLLREIAQSLGRIAGHARIAAAVWRQPRIS